MDDPETIVALRRVAGQLDASGIPWCVFAGAALNCYGVQRAITDIDVLLGPAEAAQIAALFPGGKLKGENCLELAPMELWWGRLRLRGGRRSYTFALDERMHERISRRPLLGVTVPVMSPEDIIVCKAILQRRPDVGKHDLEDIQDLIEALGGQLDSAYLRERAHACGATERVERCLTGLGVGL